MISEFLFVIKPAYTHCTDGLQIAEHNIRCFTGRVFNTQNPETGRGCAMVLKRCNLKRVV